MIITKENAGAFVFSMNKTLDKLTYSGKSVRFNINESGNTITLDIDAEPIGYYNCLSHSQVRFPLDFEEVYVNATSFDDFEKRIMVDFCFAGDDDLIVYGTTEDLRHCTELSITQWSIDLKYEMKVGETWMFTTSTVTIAEKSEQEEYESN